MPILPGYFESAQHQRRHPVPILQIGAQAFGDEVRYDRRVPKLGSQVQTGEAFSIPDGRICSQVYQKCHGLQVPLS